MLVNKWPSANMQLGRVGFNLEYCNPEVKAFNLPVSFYNIKFLKLYIIHTGYNEEFLKYCVATGNSLSQNSRRQLSERECIDLSQTESQCCKWEMDMGSSPNQEPVCNLYPLAKEKLVFSNRVLLGILTTLHGKFYAQE